MNRDGANESLWQDQMPAFIPAQSNIDREIYDVIIVGGGITGITTALELQRAGKQCLVAEGKNLCFGTTGGTTAHLNNFFDKTYAEITSDFGKEGAGIMATAATEALALYRHNIESLKADCDYYESDGVLFATDEQQAKELDEILKTSRESGIDVRYTDKIPINTPFMKAIAYSGQGSIHPAKYVYALAKSFESIGGVILESCLVTGVEAGEVIEVASSRGPLKTRQLIYATHIPPGVNLLHLRCAPYRSYVLGIELEDNNYPVSPCYDMLDPYHYYRTHETDGKKYLIAGGEDHKTGHEADTEKPFAKLEKYLRGIFSIKNIMFKWSSQYFEPVDGLAYIGHLPGADKNIFVATGFGGNGMTYSHIAANYFRNLLVRKEVSYQDLLSPARVKPVAGFSSFIRENADVVASFIVDRFNIHSLETLANIPKDSADIVKYENHSLAVYKSESGELTAVNPVCTHLKCTVKWNQTEKSWDCPCHGARFSTGGEVLTGPANKGLEKIVL